MARTLTKQEPIRNIFLKEALHAIATPLPKSDLDGHEWSEYPVGVEQFCQDFLNAPLYPLQLEFVLALTGVNPAEFNTLIDNGIAMWGKGSGKDMTMAKFFLYTAYKFNCLRNPQRYLREKHNCSIQDGDTIDFVNISVTGDHAKTVYFEKFKTLLKRCRNPKTHNNWFVEHGMDIREGYDIQNEYVQFPKAIRSFSLNSVTYTGEGKNIFLAVLDEFGNIPHKKAFDLLWSIESTGVTRFPQLAKIILISFLYEINDPIYTAYNQAAEDPRTFRSKHATYEVNPQSKKSNFAKHYHQNPERAKRTYECEATASEGGYVTKKYMLNYMFTPANENPVKGDLISVKSTYLNTLIFKDWFKGVDERLYACHFDLATGNKEHKNDMIGFALTHCEKMFPVIDPRFKSELAKEGIIIELSESDLTISRKGVVVDLALQIVAERGQDVQFSDLQNFIFILCNRLKFNIVYVTFDGWQSRNSVQILQEKGINSYEYSVDKNNTAYDSWKELMYQQLFKGYQHEIAEREAKELIVNNKGIVDHPEKSFERQVKEGIDKGSKDVLDAIVAAGKIAFENFNVDPGIFFG